MSAKYRRVKQADAALPAPLRWLTRAFSSITLAVCFLIGVALFGVLGSVPFYFIVIGVAYLIVGVIGLGLGLLAVRSLIRKDMPGPFKLIACLAAAAIACVVVTLGCIISYQWLDAWPLLAAHHTTVIYRLPFMEMNEPEFYGWWPMQALLYLFVINMVWATVRRIEFKLVNIGVLSVHSGIVIMALGAAVYGQLKLEGDMFVVRQDLGGYPVGHFYSRNDPALFISRDNGSDAEFSLKKLPRYNDYADGELDIAIHDQPGFTEYLGENLRVTIPSFFAYADLQEQWLDASDIPGNASPHLGPALTLRAGGRNGPHAGDLPVTLIAGLPARRVVQGPGFEIEYLHKPDPERIADLQSETDAAHVIIVNIPDSNYRHTLKVAPGTAYPLGVTGYILEVLELGPYDIPFVSESYQGASDTRALVRITGHGKDFTRIALHRYPERSQDFIKTGNPGEGPMGTRQDPDPAIQLTYLDNTKRQYHLITGVPDADPAQVHILLRVPGLATSFAPLPEPRVPIVFDPAAPQWMHIIEQFAQAVPVKMPVSVPKASRDPKIEGTYEQAVVPVKIEYDVHDDKMQPTGETFERTVYLRQMPYLEHTEGDLQPARVDIPRYGKVEIAFSRRRHALPFAVMMQDFEMTPYPGSDIPRDFSSDLAITPITPEGQLADNSTLQTTHLNNPVVYRTPGAPLPTRKVKISQAGWDPGDPSMPEAQRQARDEAGRFINQQRFTILGIGNNVAIRAIAFGLALVVLGIPWAFYIKPWLVRRKSRQLAQAHLQKPNPPTPTSGRVASAASTPVVSEPDKPKNQFETADERG